MTASNYDEALRRVLVHEGGFSNHPSDPGGVTLQGVTQATYDAFRKSEGLPKQALTPTLGTKAGWLKERNAIYRQRYWNPLLGDELAVGVDYAVFDYSVNSGVGRSAKVLQRLCGVDVDGEVGPQTIAYARVRDPMVLCAAICDERIAFLRGLSTWPTFGKGWKARVDGVREVSMKMAGLAQGVTPAEKPPAVVGAPPWLDRMNAILGLYEFPGAHDNPAIIQMAQACGGKIKSTYKHDSIAWCALTMNWCLMSCGLPGNDSLWALDFRKYGVKLDGPAVGAIATMKRFDANGNQVGGHVFEVVGRTSSAMLVGRGGNQSDMVCDSLFNPADCQFNWPAGWPKPSKVGFDNLPVVLPQPKTKKSIVLPAPVKIDVSGKGEVPSPTKSGPVGGAAVGAGGMGYAVWDWISTNPMEAAVIAAAGGTLVYAGVTYGLRQWWEHKQFAPTPGIIPVYA